MLTNDDTFLKVSETKAIKRRYIVSVQIIGTESDHQIEVTDTLGRTHRLPRHYNDRRGRGWTEAEAVMQDIVDAGDGVQKFVEDEKFKYENLHLEG
jgi:hypothetical protein